MRNSYGRDKGTDLVDSRNGRDRESKARTNMYVLCSSCLFEFVDKCCGRREQDSVKERVTALPCVVPGAVTTPSATPMRVAQKNNERPRVGKLVDLTRVEESTNRNGATVNATTADTNIDTEATDIDSDENQNENNNGTGVDTNRKQQDNSIGKLIETVIARRHQRAGKIKTDDPAINISGWVYSFIPYVSCSCSMLPF
jgi:hypothetical protein